MEVVYQGQSQEHEALLVEQAIERDHSAFTCLYECTVERVYRHVYYHVSNPTEAEDITQEVFVRAWKSITQYRNTGAPFVAWLIAIARNLIIDHYRAKKKVAPVCDTEAIDQPDDTNVETLVESELSKGHIKSLILKLKGDRQKVILMRFIDGFSYEEIAKALNKSEGAIRVIQYRALNDLRRMLTHKENI